MTKSVFPYPGGKSRYSDWIIKHFPEHKQYVEPFGGSAAVLFNKPESRTEIFNDLDGDIVHFFRVMRDKPEELKDWIDMTPYSRQLHEEYAEMFYNGERPKDDIERAGIFLYLRFSQWGSKIDSKQPFKVKKDGHTPGYRNKVQEIEEIADRFKDVVIECLDYTEIAEKYDGEDSFFYFDPPYVDVGDEYYTHDGSFDHEQFVECLNQIEGKYCVSYGAETPESLISDESFVVSRDQKYSLKASEGEGSQHVGTERLVMNYDPSDASFNTEGSDVLDF